jgi:hypothetical protein
VPIDDENCWAWSTNHHATRPLKSDEQMALEEGKGIHVPLIPGTFRPVANKDNDYLMDRKAQKEGVSFSGIEGFAMQDASVQESMGPIQDRTRENLVPTDQGIIMARRRLVAAAQGLAQGVQPPGVDPQHQRVRSVSIILPKDVAFSEAAEDALMPEPGSAHATV